MKTNWVFEGVRDTPVLEACFKLVARSRGLKKEIGVGLEHFIVNHKGEYFVYEGEAGRVSEAVHALPNDLAYVEKTIDLKNRTLANLSKSQPDTGQVVGILIDQLVSFYIAREKTDQLFEEGLATEEQQQKVRRWRDDATLFSGHDKFLEVLSKKLNVPSETIDMLTTQEVRQLVTGSEPDWWEIRKRLSSPWSVRLGAKREVEFASEYIAPEGTALNESPEAAREITGTPVVAGAGIIQGIVGQDILVVEMTRPEDISEMKKSKAVITNQGGILSHAAVTCRELGIPSIIGTGNATQALEDGDEVEVDASEGIVRIIKRASEQSDE